MKNSILLEISCSPFIVYCLECRVMLVSYNADDMCEKFNVANIYDVRIKINAF